MNTLVFDSLESLLTKLPMVEIVGRAVDLQDDFMLELNKEQLAQGVNSKGQNITPEYAASTVKRKMAKGQPYDRVTLKDTGEWQEGFRIKVYPTKREIFSIDIGDKDDSIIKRYGPEVEGLTDSNISLVRDRIKPLIIADIRTVIKGGTI